MLAGGPGGPLDFLDPDGYRKMGLPANLTPDLVGQTDTELGIPFHADSAFLRGIPGVVLLVAHGRTGAPTGR